MSYEGDEMRLFAVLVAICALCQPAIAQTPECKSISNASARLACYDKAAPPVASSATAKPPVRAAPVFAETEYVTIPLPVPLPPDVTLIQA